MQPNFQKGKRYNMYFEALNSLNIDDLIKEEYTVLAHIEEQIMKKKH